MMGHAFGDSAWSAAAPDVLRVWGDTLRWRSATTPIRQFGDDDPTRAAAVILISLAGSAAEACASARRVLVTGDGLVGETVRASVTATCTGEGDFDAIVETTGDEAVIRGALEELPPFGLLVLTAPSSTPLTLNLYPDVHRRGLKIAGVAPPIVGDPAWTPSKKLVAAAAAAPPPSSHSAVSSLWWHREIESL